VLAERERATGAQMVVAIFRSLEGESLEDFSVRLAERWRIGQKGLDNGVILLAFVDDRKLRLEVGYGLEGALTDAVSAQIIRERIAPRFREGRYAAGIEAAIDAVFARIDSTPVAARPRPSGKSPLGLSWIALLFIVGVVVFIVISQMRGPRGPSSGYTGSRRGWSGPVVIPPIVWGGGRGGWGGGWGGGGGGGGFSGGGGGFGGGGASGDW
jgi:uncharacterized protein